MKLKGGDLMKKYLPLVLLAVVFVFTACGSKPDKDTQKVIDKIVAETTRVDNVDLEEGQKPYSYKESDFSFLIYKDKDTNRYIADVWVPFEGKSNDMEYFYGYNENKELSQTDYKSDFKDWKSEGSYEEVYKSGKFK